MSEREPLLQSHKNPPKKAPSRRADREQARRLYNSENTNPNQPIKYGLDAEISQKIEAKWDPKLEHEALDWVEALTDEELNEPFWETFKDGILLCRVINSLQNGIVKKMHFEDLNVLQERENIQSYLAACQKLGVPSHDLFTISDLHERKDLNAVLNNIFALGRVAQGLPGFDGPILGQITTQHLVTDEKIRRMTISAEREADKQRTLTRIREKNVLQKLEQEELRREEGSRLELKLKADDEQRQKDMEDRKRTRSVISPREAGYGSVRSSSIGKGSKLASRGEIPSFLKNAEAPSTETYQNQPVDLGYGMDAEIRTKLVEKYDVARESKALEWVERMIQEPIDEEFYPAFRSGVILCTLINVISPEMIPKINMRPIPLMERTNINAYLEACEKLGVPRGCLFSVSDLHESKYLAGVVENIYALARTAAERKDFQGPYLLVHQGKGIVSWSKSPEDEIKVTDEAPTGNAGGEEAKKRKCCGCCVIC